MSSTTRMILTVVSPIAQSGPIALIGAPLLITSLTVIGGEWVRKPDSVSSVRWWPFIWDVRCRTPLAPYPGTRTGHPMRRIRAAALRAWRGTPWANNDACSPMWACSGRGLASRRVTTPLVRSYRTFSPLPALASTSNRLLACPRRREAALARCRRCRFCATFRRVAPPGISPASCPVESGLSSFRSWRNAATRPTLHIPLYPL